MTRDFRKELAEEKVLILDGAMGTMLYNEGVYINRSFEELNLSQPDLVKQIHQQYLDAGADILMTNTFSANRQKLEAYELGEQVGEINRAAVKSSPATRYVSLCTLVNLPQGQVNVVD